MGREESAARSRKRSSQMDIKTYNGNLCGFTQMQRVRHTSTGDWREVSQWVSVEVLWMHKSICIHKHMYIVYLDCICVGKRVQFLYLPAGLCVVQSISYKNKKNIENRNMWGHSVRSFAPLHRVGLSRLSKKMLKTFLEFVFALNRASQKGEMTC